jgi:hypothetical protein
MGGPGPVGTCTEPYGDIVLLGGCAAPAAGAFGARSKVDASAGVPGGSTLDVVLRSSVPIGSVATTSSACCRK